MERKLQERMVGAGVLVLVLVVVGPMILDGRSGDVTEEVVPGQRSEELRTHTFEMNDGPAPPPRAGAAAAPSATPARQPASLTGAAPTPASPSGSGPAGAPVVPATPLPDAAPEQARNVKIRETPQAAPAPAAAAPQTASGSWLVQVGTFGQKDNADRLTASLKQRGFAAFVSPAVRSGKTLYRVRVGPAGTREDAGAVASRLAAAGQAGQVVAQ